MKYLSCLFIGSTLIGLATHDARADYTHRFAFGFGIVEMTNPSETDLEIGAEYEYRFDPVLGIGAAANYIFVDPSIALVAVPDFFVHPLENDWIVSASPLLEFGSGIGSSLGVRLGTRVPVPLGPLTLIPSVAVDFIDGGRNLWFGLGIQI